MDCIAIDIGTTTFKAALFRDARRVCTVEREYPLRCSGDGAAEQDASQWRLLAESAVRELSGRIAPGCLPRIVVSSQGITCVPVDRAGEPLCPAISWLDTRAREECGELEKLFAPGELFSLTGKRASAQYTLQKILWLRRNRPEIFRETDRFLLPADYLTAKFTGNFLTEHTLAAGTLLYGLRERDWNGRILAACGLRRELFPEIRSAGSPAGRLLAGAAQRLGLPAGCEVLVGCQDQKAAALAAGLSETSATLSLGTSGALEFLLGAPVLDAEQGLPCFPYFNDTQYVLEGVLPTAGACIKWLKGLLGAESYAALDELAASAPPSSGGVRFFPDLSGEGSPFWRESAARVTGLALHTGRACLVRAAYEGIALLVLKNLRHARKLGARPKRLHVFGGGAKSDILCRIIADVCGLPVLRLSDPEAVLLGNALLAGAERPETAGGLILPDAERAAFYAAWFEREFGEEYSAKKKFKGDL